MTDDFYQKLLEGKKVRKLSQKSEVSGAVTVPIVLANPVSLWPTPTRNQPQTRLS